MSDEPSKKAPTEFHDKIFLFRIPEKLWKEFCEAADSDDIDHHEILADTIMIDSIMGYVQSKNNQLKKKSI